MVTQILIPLEKWKWRHVSRIRIDSSTLNPTRSQASRHKYISTLNLHVHGMNPIISFILVSHIPLNEALPLSVPAWATRDCAFNFCAFSGKNNFSTADPWDILAPHSRMLLNQENQIGIASDSDISYFTSDMTIFLECYSLNNLQKMMPPL